MDSPQPLRPPADHMPQLDGLRGIAVGLVIFGHWGATGGRNALPFGWFGVQLFFVLSGFLITGILLRARADDPATGERMFALRSFYARRFLRIFPLYYLAIAYGLIAKAPGARDAVGWHLTYTTNFYLFLKNQWAGVYSHFWTLAVEEQFYLLWPWVVLFVPRRALPAVVGLVIAGGMAFALQMGVWKRHYGPGSVLLPPNAVALGAGALLAVLSCRPGALAWYRRACLGVLIASVIAYALPVRWGEWGGQVRNWTVQIGCVWLVAGAAARFRGPAGWLLQWRPLVFVGTISYGLYVMHPLVRNVVDHFAPRLTSQVPLMGSHAGRMGVALGILLLAATASWFAYERPLNRLKRYFPYRRRPARAAGESQVVAATA